MPGIWLTEVEYAERFRLSRQTLSNWRFQETHGKLGENRPVWKKFGSSVRYFIPAQEVA